MPTAFADAPSVTPPSLKRRALDVITDRSDGPVTFFVALARATDLARTGRFPKVGIDCPIANALDEFFADHGFDTDRTLLSSNERG